MPDMEQMTCSADTMVNILRQVPDDTYLYFDIESHPPTNTCQCFSLKWPGSRTYSLTVYDYAGRRNGNIPAVFAALARTMRRTTVVIHNAFFDLQFLAHYHGFPYGARVEDTMAMWHRLFPEAEKSLGHVMSAVLNEPFHKGTATFTPHNYQQQSNLLRYNAKDVHALEGVHRALRQLASADDGYVGSFLQVSASIPVYMRAGFRGFDLDMMRLREHKTALAARQKQLVRVFRILVGLPEINPNSNDQLAAWLITGLDYKPVGKTDSGAPSMDAKSLYQFRLKHPQNVALTVLLAIKKVSKQLSMLGFEPFNHLTAR
jgi:DNA polymerase I-like protein with 3'-5' exonuclease and polymerase domains